MTRRHQRMQERQRARENGAAHLFVLRLALLILARPGRLLGNLRDAPRELLATLCLTGAVSARSKEREARGRDALASGSRCASSSSSSGTGARSLRFALAFFLRLRRRPSRSAPLGDRESKRKDSRRRRILIPLLLRALLLGNLEPPDGVLAVLVARIVVVVVGGCARCGRGRARARRGGAGTALLGGGGGGGGGAVAVAWSGREWRQYSRTGARVGAGGQEQTLVDFVNVGQVTLVLTELRVAGRACARVSAGRGLRGLQHRVPEGSPTDNVGELVIVLSRLLLVLLLRLLLVLLVHGLLRLWLVCESGLGAVSRVRHGGGGRVTGVEWGEGKGVRPW